MGQCCFGTEERVNSEMEQANNKKRAPNPRVLIIENDVLCPPASAISSLVEHGIPYQLIFAFHESAFKLYDPLMYEAIIVLGGRAPSVNDKGKQIAWFAEEINFIQKALKNKIPILGICLGAQVLADCVGGNVMFGDQGVEIGFDDWLFADDNDDNKHADADDMCLCEMDPFIRALKHKDLDKFVVLFHSETFNLPKQCVLSGQTVKLLAKTEKQKYKTLYKVGEYSYGFQGHPELNYDLLQIWLKAWNDDFLSKSGVDLNEVLLYAKKNKKLIDQNGKILFDIWIDIVFGDAPKLSSIQDTDIFDKYANQHWNYMNNKQNATYSGFFISED